MNILDKKTTSFPTLEMFLIIIVLFAIPSISLAKDVILDGNNAINWLVNNKYINNSHIPQHNFYTFRSQVMGGGVGPRGLKAIMANGWTFSGPLNNPIKKPIVIVVDNSSLKQSPIKYVKPTCNEVGFSSSCTSSVFKLGSTFVCSWRGGCTDSVFTIQNIIGNKVEMYRADQSCPFSRGLTATYSGTLTGRHLSGTRKILNSGSGTARPGVGNTVNFNCNF